MVHFRLAGLGLAGIATLALIGAAASRVGADRSDVEAAGRPGDFLLGADLSLLQFIEDHGVEYRMEGEARDPLVIFRENGFNMIRLRLFLAPDGTEGQVNTLSYTLQLAKRVKAAGLGFMLDLHYSDKWADPSHQTIPAEWAHLSHAELVDHVYAYTRETLSAFRREGVTPDIVEVGNEITNGMMWPDAGPLFDPAKWSEARQPSASDAAGFDALADLLRAGIRGVRDAGVGDSVRTMIHIDKGGSLDTSKWFFENIMARNVEFDLIAVSYYPFWHGTLDELKANLAYLSTTYEKDLIVAETGYDTWGGEQGVFPFPLTEEGQRQFLEELIRVVKGAPGGRGKGVFYWAPEWIMGTRWGAPPWSHQWEDRALFDSTGNTRPGMRAFRESAR